MKHIFYTVLLAGIVSFSTLSCKKEQVTNSGYQGNGSTNYNASGQTIELTANNWKQDQAGIYSHTFKNVLIPYSGKSVNVYLSTNGAYIPLSQFINFMNGQLSASHTPTDVKIVFRCSGQLPFTSLYIKVVIE